MTFFPHDVVTANLIIDGQIAAVSREMAQDIKLSECDIQYKEYDVGHGLNSQFRILCADFGSVPCEVYDYGGL